MAPNESTDAALVLFSGGQDSTVCLAWALTRFRRVETIGFEYGQRHGIEMTVRPRIRDKLAALDPRWKERLGEDHVVNLDSLGQISETALTRNAQIEMTASGLPSTCVSAKRRSRTT